MCRSVPSRSWTWWPYSASPEFGGHAAYDQGKVSRAEIAAALDAAASVGDDRIQRATRGRVSPETFTHGLSASRQKWFTIGMQTGDPAACDTFATPHRVSRTYIDFRCPISFNPD
jgi:hypothetical protein